MMCGFTKGVSVDVLYLKINAFFEVNLPYGQYDFRVNLDHTIVVVLQTTIFCRTALFCWDVFLFLVHDDGRQLRGLRPFELVARHEGGALLQRQVGIDQHRYLESEALLQWQVGTASMINRHCRNDKSALLPSRWSTAAMTSRHLST